MSIFNLLSSLYKNKAIGNVIDKITPPVVDNFLNDARNAVSNKVSEVVTDAKEFLSRNKTIPEAISNITPSQVMSGIETFQNVIDPSIISKGKLFMQAEKAADPYILEAINTPVGQKIAVGAAESTSNIPLRAAASSLDTIHGVFTGKWDNDTEKAWLQARNDPDQSTMAKFLFNLQDSGFQTALGVVMSLIPVAGTGLSSAYWTALSAEEQRQKDRDGDGTPDGKVYSTTNLGIDVALDSLLGRSIGSLLKEGGNIGFKNILKTLKKNGITEGVTEVTQSILKYGNDYLRAKTPEERAQIGNEFKNYLQNEMAMEFSTAFASGALIAGGGVVTGSPNINAVSQTVNISEQDKALIQSGLDAAKEKIGLTQDVIKDGLTEANKNVDQTQNPVVQTALELTQNTSGIVSPTEGITTAQNINGHILYNPSSPTVVEDIVGAAFEPVIDSFTNTMEAIDTSYKYEQGDLTKEIVQKIKEEMDRRGLNNTSKSGVEKFLKQQLFKSVAYKAMTDAEFEKTHADLYNAFVADLKGGRQTKTNLQAVKETQRRYSSKNYTVAQAQERFTQDLETYKTTGKFPSRTLKNIYEQRILEEKIAKKPEYKRTMGKAEKKAREEVRKSEMENKTLSSKLSSIAKQNISKEDLNNLELNQAEKDIVLENFGDKETIKLEDLQKNVSNSMAALTADIMVAELDEAFSEEVEKDETLKGLDVTKEEVEKDATNFITARMASIEPEKFQLNRIDVGGSRVTGDPTDISDIDIMVYYRGEMDEDQVWDTLRDTNLETGGPLTGGGEMAGYKENISGNTAKINFQPVRISKELEDPIKVSNAFSFVSPNIEENLSPEMVAENMTSQRHTYIRKLAQEIDDKMGFNSKVLNAAGFWGDGQENTLFTLYKDIDNYEDLLYNVALKGLMSDQKAVIPFLVDENGLDSLYVISFGNESEIEAEKKLTHFGIEYKTIFKVNGKTMAAVFDKESGLGETINNFKQYADSITSYKGRGEFLGNKNTWDENTRAGARRIYREVIRAYEESHSMRDQKRSQSLTRGRIVRSQGVRAIDVDDIAKNKYELTDDNLIFETEDYSVYNVDGKQLIKTNTNLGFEVLEGFDAVEKGLDFIVIENINLGDIRDTADYMTANKIINEDLVASNDTIKSIIYNNTDLSVNKLLTVREKTLLKTRIRAIAKGAKMGWKDARATLNLAFRTKLDALKDIRAALVQEIKTLNPEDQAKMINRLNSITSKDQAVKIERAYIAIRDLKNEADRQDLIRTVKKIAAVVKRKLSTGTGVNYAYIKMMADLLEAYNVNAPTKDTIKKLTELKTYLESLGSREVEKTDGTIETVYNHPAGMYIPKLALLEKKNIADLSKEELQDLNESLVELWNIGKAVYKDDKAKIEERARINSALLRSSVENLDAKTGDDKARDVKDKLTSRWLDFMHTFRAFNRIDGYQNYNGVAVAWQRRIHGDTTRAEDRHNKMMKETFKEIQSIVGKDGRITDEEIEAVAFYLYADQESYDEDGQLIANPQAQSVIDANGWTEPPARTERIDAIVRLLRDKMDSVYDELSQTFIQVENKAFPRLKNYFPYFYDRAGNITFEPSASQVKALRKGAKKDFSYSRKKNVKKKVRTDVLSIFSNSMYERYYYIEVQPTLKEMKEMLNYKEITEDENGKQTVSTFEDHAGHVVAKYFADFIDIIANRGKKSGFNNSRILDALRQNVSYAVMGYNLVSAMMQGLAIADAVVWTGIYRGNKSAAKMMARFSFNFLNPRFASKVKSQSAVLRNRQGGEFAFADLSPKQTSGNLVGNSFTNSLIFLRKHAYDMIKAPDIQTAAIVQESIYRDLRSENPEMNEEEARREAEFIMNIVSGSADVADRPLALGKSQFNRLLLTFQTFILNRFGMVGEDFVMQKLVNSGNSRQMMNTLNNLPRKKLDSILAALFGFILISMVGAFENIYRREVRKYVYGKQDTKTDFMTDAMFAYVEMIPFFGGAISDARAGRQVGASVDLPTLSFIADFANGLNKLKSDSKDTRTKGEILVVKSMASLFGVPGSNFASNIFSQFVTEPPKPASTTKEKSTKSSLPKRPKREARPKRPARPSR